MIGIMEGKAVRIQADFKVSADIADALAVRLGREGYDRSEFFRRVLEKELAEELDYIRMRRL